MDAKDGIQAGERFSHAAAQAFFSARCARQQSVVFPAKERASRKINSKAPGAIDSPRDVLFRDENGSYSWIRCPNDKSFA
jgi:hypothetical protein